MFSSTDVSDAQDKPRMDIRIKKAHWYLPGVEPAT